MARNNTVEIVLSARDEASKATKSAFESIKGSLQGIAGVIAGAFAVDAIAGFGKSIVETAADSQAAQGQYEQVMAGMKDNTDKYLGEMSEKWNKHPNELKGAYMQYVAILKSKGLAEKDAHSIAKGYLDKTVDANAFANEDMGDTVARFMGGIKGEYDSLDTAMVNLSATMMNDLSMKEYGKKFDDLSVAQQEQLKVQEMLRQHTSAGVVGQGAREADSYANNVAMLKNKWSDLMTSFGSPMLEVANDALKGLTGIVGNIDTGAIMDGFSSFGNYIGGVFSPIVAGVKNNWKEFMGFMENSGPLDAVKVALDNVKEGFAWFKDNLPNITAGIGDFIDKFDFLLAGLAGGLLAFQLITGAIALWNNIVKIATAVQTAWNAVMAMNPIAMVAIAIGALIAIGILLYKNWDTIKEKMGQAWDGLKEKASTVWNGIKDWISNSWESIKSKTSEVWNGIRSFLVGLWNGIKSTATTVWEGIKSGISNVVNGIKSTISNVWNGIKSATSSVWNGIKEAITNPIETAKNTISGIIGKIKGFFTGLILKIPTPSLPKLPHFSLTTSSKTILGKEIKYPTGFNVDWYDKGGVFYGPQVIGVGEKRPEFVGALDDLRKIVREETAGRDVEQKSQIPQYAIINIDGRQVMLAMIDYINEEQDLRNRRWSTT